MPRKKKQSSEAAVREIRERLSGGVEKIVGKGDDVADSLLRQVRRVLGNK